MTHGKANEAGTFESHANDSWRTIRTETTMEQWPSLCSNQSVILLNNQVMHMS